MLALSWTVRTVRTDQERVLTLTLDIHMILDIQMLLEFHLYGCRIEILSRYSIGILGYHYPELCIAIALNLHVVLALSC